jgi:spore maturation protein CgeB
MKIFLYGELWEGTHIDSISKVLNKLKIENQTFNFYNYFQYYTPFLFLNKVLRRLFLFYNRRRMNIQLLIKIESFEPTIFLISKGIDIYPETLIKIKNKNIVIANWNPDDFFNQKNSNLNLLSSLNHYDIVFSSRKHLFHEYIRKGIRNPIYLEWYYLPSLHFKKTENEEFIEKLTFIGSYSERREKIIKAINGIEIEIWGSGWHKANFKSANNITCHNKILSQSNFPSVIGKSLINLNILTRENRDQTNLKIFEIVASGGVILTEDNDITRKILGEDCFYYDGINNINTIIQKIKNMPKKSLLQKRHKTFLKLISSRNSIDDRIKEMLKHF